MFADEALDTVSVQSLWRKSHEAAQESKGCQTQMFRSAESEVQVISTTISSTQTELQEQATEQLIQQNQDEPEPPGLKDFLQQVEDMVVRELVKNVRSHAFDGFQASWEDHSQRVLLIHSLQHPGAKEKGLHVTSVSWSCTGSVIACAYGLTMETGAMRSHVFAPGTWTVEACITVRRTWS